MALSCSVSEETEMSGALFDHSLRGMGLFVPAYRTKHMAILGIAVLFVGRNHLVTHPLLPTLEKFCAGPARVSLSPPRHVNDRERHVSALNLKQNVVSVNPGSDCSRLRAIQDVFRRNFRFQPSRKSFRSVRNFVRSVNDAPRSQ